jgi:hypothetical protein
MPFRYDDQLEEEDDDTCEYCDVVGCPGDCVDDDDDLGTELEDW